FAAKEALAKALGAPAGLVWTDVTVTKADDGRPGLDLHGTLAARAQELGITRTHVSITHDAGVATAIVICED
ncbi:MAG TPA: holo-ACP synthase, partial [Propionibacteriaceae bacterium]|nr:holo-ACP synthase [Propionibacteriaceae bacterium]HBY21837.1 holo-ACP synthase [Propionibacteriaceae bacterium]